MSKVLLSGIRPTDKSIHLGNYFGFLKAFLNNSIDKKFLFSADLHCLTTHNSIESLSISKFFFVLFGDKVTFFRQSKFKEIPMISWFLSCQTNISLLNRMIQYKEKSQNNPNCGLFFYPLLMAADIAIHCINQEVYVPIGLDQDQHFNYIVDMFEVFNKSFNNILVKPSKIQSEGLTIKSLVSSKKMSKSEPEGAIFFLDTDEEITFKIKKAVTDSHLLPNSLEDLKNRPNVYNLYLIYKLITEETWEFIINKYKNNTISIFKKDITEILINFIKPIREKVLGVTDEQIKKILENNEEKMKDYMLKNFNVIYNTIIKG